MTELIKIGIIGGKGNMGSLFARVFANVGVAVEVSDLNTELSNADVIKRNNIVIFSLPLAQTPDLISELMPLTHADQLLVDITSLKVKAVASMLKSNAEVLGLHPMFGPNLNDIQDQLILVCRARESQRTQVFLSLLSKLGAKLKETTPEKHDQIMSVVQGLNHLGSIITADAMSELGVDIKESLEYASPAYRIRMDLVARILAQDGSLYADIALENPLTVKAIEQFISSAQSILEILKSKDKKAMLKLFENLGNYFGDVKEEGLQSSNKLIEGLLKKA